MLERKRELKQSIVNTAFERVRLTHMLDVALEKGDSDLSLNIKSRLDDLEIFEKSNKSQNSDNMNTLARLNARNRENNLKEGQEAEKAALVQKRLNGVKESDPFARRKTAPVHIVNEPKVVEAVAVSPESLLSVSRSVSVQEVEVTDDEDIFDNIDVSMLEEELEQASYLP